MSMTTITTTVKLDTTKNALDVEDHGAPISVQRNADGTRLTWQLTGNAAQGSFNVLDAPNPGFKWISQPPPPSFSELARSSNGNQITLLDNNNGATGTWYYQLWATINGVEYSTKTLSTRATTNNPAIKNE